MSSIQQGVRLEGVLHYYSVIQEVKIPGKKDFGFSYESRLFVTNTEEESQASDILLPGDEIIQVRTC